MDKIIFDASPSMRRLDENGFMHVRLTPISKACVNPYLGSEIPEWEEHGLKPNEIYYVLRDPEELKKAAETFNGLPLLLDHHEESADMPAKEFRVGSTGTDAVFKSPYLMNSLSIMDAEAIKAVESGEMKELSCCYMYDPDYTPGTFEGVAYDLIMRNIRGNHVALVHEGRAGHDVAVADAANIKVKEETMRKTAKDEAPDAVTLEKVLAALKALKGGEATPEEVVAAFKPEATDEEKAAIADELSEYAPESKEADIPADEEPEGEETGKDCEAIEAAFSAGVQAGAQLEAIAEEAPADEAPEGEEKGLENSIPADSVRRLKKAAKDEARKEIMSHMRELSKAANDTRATLGNIDMMAFDSANDIYKKALEVEGYNTKGFKGGEFKAMWSVAKANKAAVKPAFDSKRYEEEGLSASTRELLYR